MTKNIIKGSSAKQLDEKVILVIRGKRYLIMLLLSPFKGSYVLLMVIPATSVVHGAVRAVAGVGWTGCRHRSSSCELRYALN